MALLEATSRILNIIEVTANGDWCLGTPSKFRGTSAVQEHPNRTMSSNEEASASMRMNPQRAKQLVENLQNVTHRIEKSRGGRNVRHPC